MRRSNAQPQAAMRLTRAPGRRHRRCTCSCVSSCKPQGPRAWNLSVLMPISAPRPNSKPSLKRVLALTSTADGIDRRREPPGRGQVVGHDRVGVLRAVAGDVGDRLVQVGHHLHRQDQVEILGGVVVLGRRLRVGDQRRVSRAAAQLDAALAQGRRRARQESARRRRAWTSRLSAALQTPGRWHLALTRIRSAMSRSAARST